MDDKTVARPAVPKVQGLKPVTPEQMKEIKGYFVKEGSSLYSSGGFSGDALAAKAEDFAKRATDYVTGELVSLINSMSKEEQAALLKHPQAIFDSVGICIDDFIMQEALKVMSRDSQQPGNDKTLGYIG